MILAETKKKIIIKPLTYPTLTHVLTAVNFVGAPSLFFKLKPVENVFLKAKAHTN